MTLTSERYTAFVTLLAMKDPEDLPKRSRRWTQPGKPGRDALRLELERAYLRYRIQEAGRDESAIVSVRRWPLHLVRRKDASA